MSEKPEMTSYPRCVVCHEPVGDEHRTFPDGCPAHERCFVDAPWEQIRSHMVTASSTGGRS